MTHSTCRILSFVLLTTFFFFAQSCKTRQAAVPAVTVPQFQIPVGKVRPPLPFRIISFHRGRADKNLIKLAAQLGFNGVQFQIEGSNEAGIADFAARDAKEHLVDYCHSLGMKVTVWVHELSDMPGPWLPEYWGEPTEKNETVWSNIAARYDWILGQAIPNVDGLALTVVETQYRATNTAVMLRLVDVVNKKCQQYGKSLMVRTFVWTPEEFAGVMGAVKQLPKDTVIMSKIVPQDWQMRGTFAAELGAVEGHAQIVEFDAAGEYFLHNAVANCMVDLLKKQYDYAVSKGAQGICVRADRFDDSVLFEPNEVNLWTLGMLASGATDKTDDIWNQWATARYNAQAAPAVIAALKGSADVVAEMLSIGPFTMGDTRQFPALPDASFFSDNWQNWRWDPSFEPAHQQAEHGAPAFVAEVQRQKQHALAQAQDAIEKLAAAKAFLSDTEYQILATRLLSNKVQLQFGSAVALAILHYRQLIGATDDSTRRAAYDAYQHDVSAVRDIAGTLPWTLPNTIDYKGKTWTLGVPLGLDREALYHWAYDASFLPNED